MGGSKGNQAAGPEARMSQWWWGSEVGLFEAYREGEINQTCCRMGCQEVERLEIKRGCWAVGPAAKPLLSCPQRGRAPLNLNGLRIVSREGARVTCRELIARAGREKATPGLGFSINRMAEKPGAGYAP